MSTRLAMSDGEIAVRYRQAKEPQKQIKILAELCGVYKADIVAALLREGIDVNGPQKAVKRGAVKRVDYGKVEELYRRGLTDTAIAKQLDISWHTVSKWRLTNQLAANQKEAVS